MNILRRTFTIGYEYSIPQMRQRARGVQYVNIFSTLLAIGLIFFVMANWSRLGNLQPVAFAAPLLVFILTAVARRLLNSGQLVAAGRLYAGFYLLLATIVVVSVGTRTSIAMAIPIILAGLLLDRREVLIVMIMAIALVTGWAVIQQFTAQGGPALLGVILPISLALLVVGLSGWYLSSELESTFGEMLQAEISLDAAVTLNLQISRARTESELTNSFINVLQQNFPLTQVGLYLRIPDNPNLLRARDGRMVGQTAARTISVASDSPLAAVFRSGEVAVLRADRQTDIQREMLPGSQAELIMPVRVGAEILGVVDLQSASPVAFAPREIEMYTALIAAFATHYYMLALEERAHAQAADLERTYTRLEEYNAETRRLRQHAVGVVWDHFFRERRTDVIGFDLTREWLAPIAASEISEVLATTMRAGAVDIRRVEGGYVLALPIALRGQVLGAMEFLIEREGSLPPYIVDLANTVAERLSLALDNARLVEQTQALASREQRIGVVAGRLQGAGTIEDLLAVAASEFNDAVGGVRTHIRLQLPDAGPVQDPGEAPPAGISPNGGGAS